MPSSNHIIRILWIGQFNACANINAIILAWELWYETNKRTSNPDHIVVSTLHLTCHWPRVLLNSLLVWSEKQRQGVPCRVFQACLYYSRRVAIDKLRTPNLASVFNWSPLLSPPEPVCPWRVGKCETPSRTSATVSTDGQTSSQNELSRVLTTAWDSDGWDKPWYEQKGIR